MLHAACLHITQQSVSFAGLKQILAVNFRGIPGILHFQLFKTFLVTFTFFSKLRYTLVFMSRQHKIN
jgi:hypothetical protein